MDILEAVTQITGTAWNLRGDVLEQAEDGTPRIPLPSPKIIQQFIDAYTPPLTIEDRVAALEAK